MAFDDAGQGKPVVLLHAFPFSRAMWRRQLQALQAEWRVLSPDLRGFGDTPGFEGDPSLDQMADDLLSLFAEADVREPVVLGGLSMGGYIALAFARRHPSRLRALILADTRAEPDDAAARANRDKLIDFARAHSSALVVEQLLPRLVSDETRTERPEVVEEVRRIGSAQSVEGIIGGLRAMRDRKDARPVLESIRVPTLVLVGSRDIVTPPATAEELVAGIAGARLATISGAGHMSNLERPDLFNQEVRTFLHSVT
jgi:pimeloyl-ACP methyl ester carboxylesterase